MRRHEVLAVDRGRDGEQVRMPVDAQSRGHVLAHGAHAQHRVVRGIAVGLGLGHAAGMATGIRFRAALRIGQRFAEVVDLARRIGAEGRAPLRIDLGARGDGRPLQHFPGLAAQLLDFLRTDYPLEDVVAVFPVRGQDIGVQAAVLVKADRSAIADRARTLGAALSELDHFLRMLRSRELGGSFGEIHHHAGVLQRPGGSSDSPPGVTIAGWYSEHHSPKARRMNARGTAAWRVVAPSEWQPCRKRSSVHKRASDAPSVASGPTASRPEAASRTHHIKRGGASLLVAYSPIMRLRFEPVRSKPRNDQRIRSAAAPTCT